MDRAGNRGVSFQLEVAGLNPFSGKNRAYQTEIGVFGRAQTPAKLFKLLSIRMNTRLDKRGACPRVPRMALMTFDRRRFGDRQQCQ